MYFLTAKTLRPETDGIVISFAGRPVCEMFDLMMVLDVKTEDDQL